MIISLIAAISLNNAIGKNNQLPWHLPDDFKWFKEKTSNHSIIMGRKTMESLGKPLPNRRNIVISRNPTSLLYGFEHSSSVSDTLRKIYREDEVFVIGGGEIYQQFITLADKLYITQVETTVEDADAFFPAFDKKVWKETFRAKHEADEKHKYPFSFVVFEK